MAKSDDVFGIGGGDPNTALAQLMGDPGMFPNITSMGRQSEPTPEDMEKGAEDARYQKIVKIKRFHVNTWDLSDPEQLKKYQVHIVMLYMAMNEKRAVMNHLEKKMLLTDGKPKMCVHMEWYEYDMETTDHMTGKKYKTAKDYVEHKHGKKKRSAEAVGDGSAGPMGQEAPGEQEPADTGTVALV
jgi:hypothetical protein